MWNYFDFVFARWYQEEHGRIPKNPLPRPKKVVRNPNASCRKHYATYMQTQSTPCRNSRYDVNAINMLMIKGSSRRHVSTVRAQSPLLEGQST